MKHLPNKRLHNKDEEGENYKNDNQYTYLTNPLSLVSADVNECETEPCEHGGTCIDEVNGFSCNCTPGWEGNTCQFGK